MKLAAKLFTAIIAERLAVKTRIIIKMPQNTIERRKRAFANAASFGVIIVIRLIFGCFAHQFA